MNHNAAQNLEKDQGKQNICDQYLLIIFAKCKFDEPMRCSRIPVVIGFFGQNLDVRIE